MAALDPQYDPQADDEVVLKTWPKWPLLVVLLAALAVAGCYSYTLASWPEPLRVLVAIDLEGYWREGPKPAAVRADPLAERLMSLGFEPVRGGDPEVTAVLEKAKDPLEAARALKAAFVISARLVPQTIEHGETTPLSGWTGSTDRERTLLRLADDLADRSFDAVLPMRVRHPTLKPPFDTEAGTADLDLAAKIEPARSSVSARSQALAAAEKGWRLRAERRDAQNKGPVKVTWLSGPAADDLLGGTSPLGVLVESADVKPHFWPTSRRRGYLEQLEALEWRTPEGKRTVLWQGHNSIPAQ